MAELARGPRLLEEAADGDRILAGLAAQDLDRHVPHHRELQRPVDRAHPPLAEQLQDAEAAGQHLAGKRGALPVRDEDERGLVVRAARGVRPEGAAADRAELLHPGYPWQAPLRFTGSSAAAGRTGPDHGQLR